MTLLIFATILAWLIVLLGCWIGFLLIRQNGRILLRLDRLESLLTQLYTANVSGPSLPIVPSPTPTLPLASLAPDFELPDLSGNRHKLSKYRGQRVLLIFFNPTCGFCTQMASDLSLLPIDRLNGNPLPLIVTTGDLPTNRDLVKQYGITGPVLLQEQTEVASRYKANGTPMGYLIDEQGRIASEIAVGAHALLELGTKRNTPTALPYEHLGAMSENGHKRHKGNRPLSDSQLNRNGLSIGTPAPNFQLPLIDGGELSLEEYRGQRVLVIFSDPTCGPCNQLAPQLEQLHRTQPDLQIVMVSRGNVEDNRQKVVEHGLTFPVVLQRQWEISRLYAMFSTPIAYLINEHGLVASEVAMGTDSILALATGATSPTSRESLKNPRQQNGPRPTA